MDYAALTLVFGLAAAYILRSLLLEVKEDHFGPFQDYSRWVRFHKGTSREHLQPVTLFDWIRRFAGVYTVTKDPMTSTDWWWWDVKDGEGSERWTCQHCLSWWTAIPFSLLVVVWKFGVSVSTFAFWLPTNFAIAIVSQICFRFLWPDE